MNDAPFPTIEYQLPEMMDFIARLVRDSQTGNLPSGQLMAQRIKAFFTPTRLEQTDSVVTGWRMMASYADGLTLVHVMTVFTALFLCPEFQHASPRQQALMKWIVLLHDIAKEVHDGQRDPTHGFRSAAVAGVVLAKTGFAVKPDYDHVIGSWVALTSTAFARQAGTSTFVQDNSRLPEILAGIERMFGQDTAPALALKTVLLHMSINNLDEWPQAAPLTDSEIKLYLDGELFPLLKIMMLADTDAWAFFKPEVKPRHRQETLDVFDRIEQLLAEDS